MKVLDLRCANGHGFEGWFASEGDFLSQNGRRLIACPLCADQSIVRMPSAPRLNLSGAREPKEAAAPARESAAGAAAVAPPSGTALAQAVTTALPQGADLQTVWFKAVRELMAKTEDVGERFPEEARRIHYGEVAPHGIRGQATPAERAALQDEGIDTIAVALPQALKGPVQ